MAAIGGAGPLPGPIVITAETVDRREAVRPRYGVRTIGDGDGHVFAPAALDGFDDEFGGSRTYRGALAKAFGRTVRADHVIAELHQSLGTLFGLGWKFDGFRAVGAPEHHIPMLVVGNADGWAGKHPFLVRPAITRDAATGAILLNAGVPAAGTKLFGGWVQPGDPEALTTISRDDHMPILAMLDRNRIVEFATPDLIADVRGLTRGEKLGFQLRNLGGLLNHGLPR